jgi:transcriptional regulator of heat shock response
MSYSAFPGRPESHDPDLSTRQRELFAALVALHHESARPVGSEALSQRSSVALSSASVRSELAELEPHAATATSFAGW